MFIAFISLLAGALSALAPCVLPFLPVIVGGSVTNSSKARPYLVALGLVGSLLLFTILLKASTALIGVDPMVWSLISGVIVVLLGLAMLFPGVWAKVSVKLRLDSASHKLLTKARGSKRGETVNALVTGAALGPVFSSCSPVYAWLIATILPAQPLVGLLYLTFYCIGMAAMLLAISLAGRKLIAKLGWAANPYGWFQKTIAVLFIIVGALVATGSDKKVQAWVVEHVPIVSSLEVNLIPESDDGVAPRPAPFGSATAAEGAELSGPPAPDFRDISAWINSDPLTLEQLRGKVVLVDFWTYSCINCIRTQPYLNAWYDRYHDQGFEIIGVHAPEFAFEKKEQNVRDAVNKAGIKYPVALDNNFATWNAYHNHYWPAKYLINAKGEVVWHHFGEGDYEEAEQQIRAQLAAAGKAQKAGEKSATSEVTGAESPTQGQSPETYLGTARAAGYIGTPDLTDGETTYQRSTSTEPSTWSLGGPWRVNEEQIVSTGTSTLTYTFTGTEMFLVMGSEDGTAKNVTVSIEANGKKIDAYGSDAPGGIVSVGESRLYRLVKLPSGVHTATVTLTFPAGVHANAFTFG